MARAQKTTGLPARSLGTLTVALITTAALFGCEVIVVDGVSTGAGGGGPAAGVGGSPSGDSTGACSCSQTGAGGAEMSSGSSMVTGAGGAEVSSGSSSVTGAGGAGGAEMCRSDGNPCAAAADCCSGLCTNGACAAAPSCAPDGDACSADTDCCSHLCISGACSSGPICAADGDACSASADCCSEFCSNGACAVSPTVYSTSFEGACPDGWTLTGEWECGVPMNVGPATAYDGTQCIATKIAGHYDSLEPWDGNTATSPEIDLTNVATPTLTFRMWMDTEGFTYDGANLQVSADGGMNYAVLSNVMPMYNQTVAGKPAWGGHQQALGWQLMQADLSGYAGQMIRLRFAFRSDSSGEFPGVYIDDILVN